MKNLQCNIVEREFKDGNYHLILDKTIFYPHLSGGQPRDKGTIDNMEVIDVFERKDQIIHVIKERIESTNVKLSIDWDNRFDMMQQHTGQHILSLGIRKLFNGQTIGFHIGQDYASIDVDLKNLDEKQIAQIELLTNTIIQSNFPIKSYIQRKDGQDFRIVEIEDMDSNPCCGTHVYNTGEVGLLKIIKTSNYKGGSRIEFLCGIRSLKDYSWKDKYIKGISNLLSSNEKDAFEKVQGLFRNHKDLEKENRNLRKEAYNFKAQLYLKDAKEIKGVNYIVKEFKDKDIKEISLVSSILMSQKKTIQIYSIKNEDTGYFFLSKTKDMTIDLKEILEEVSQNIILKGGGNSQSIQGKSSVHILDKVIKLFYSKIREKLDE